MAKYRSDWTCIVFSRGHISKFIWSCFFKSISDEIIFREIVKVNMTYFKVVDCHEPGHLLWPISSHPFGVFKVRLASYEAKRTFMQKGKQWNTVWPDLAGFWKFMAGIGNFHLVTLLISSEEKNTKRTLNTEFHKQSTREVHQWYWIRKLKVFNFTH